MEIRVEIRGTPPVAFAQVDDSPVVHELPVIEWGPGHLVIMDSLFGGEQMIPYLPAGEHLLHLNQAVFDELKAKRKVS